MNEEKGLWREVLSIEVSKIALNPNQPRKSFSDEGIIKLADSIRQFGIIQPLTVRKTTDGYELVAGERRLRAAKELGMSSVPCILSGANDQQSAELAIIENLMREDLTIFEEAEAIEVLIDTYGLTQEKIAAKLSVSQSYIANKLRLLRLSREEREIILRSKLTERHARALLRIYDDIERQRALEAIIKEEMNVSRAEELVDKITLKSKPDEIKKRTYKSIGSFYDAINRAISAIENSGVKVKSRRVEGDSYTELTILVPKCTEPSGALEQSAN